MASAIVTSTYRYRRPPRKKKPVLIEMAAIVTPRSKAATASVPRGVKPDNDNQPVEQPVAIVAAKKPRGRKAAWVDDGQETPPEIKALIERMMLGRGRSNST